MLEADIGEGVTVWADEGSLGMKIEGRVVLRGEVGSMEYIDIERLLVAIAYPPTREPDWPVRQLEPIVCDRSFPAACSLMGGTWIAYVHARQGAEGIRVDLAFDNRKLVRLLFDPVLAVEGITAILRSNDY